MGDRSRSALPGEFGDPTLKQTSVVPRLGGTQFLIVTFPPDAVMMSADFNPEAAAAENLTHVPGLAELFERDNPGMHTTDTVDYGIVLEGEITLELDDGRIAHLQKHDVVIQNGHSTCVAQSERRSPQLMAFVLIGARRQP